MKKLILGLIAWCSCQMLMAGVMPIVVVPPHKTSFQVILPANATTGYQWSLTDYDHELLTLVSKTYQARRTHLMGRGGEAIFSFKCATDEPPPSQTTLSFTYARPWENKAVKPLLVKVVFEKPPKATSPYH